MRVIGRTSGSGEGSGGKKSKEVIHLQQELEEEVQELNRLLKIRAYPGSGSGSGGVGR